VANIAIKSGVIQAGSPETEAVKIFLRDPNNVMDVLLNGDSSDSLYEEAVWAGLQSENKGIQQTAAKTVRNRGLAEIPGGKEKVEEILGKEALEKTK
jgi:hypothetical protein